MWSITVEYVRSILLGVHFLKTFSSCLFIYIWYRFRKMFQNNLFGKWTIVWSLHFSQLTEQLLTVELALPTGRWYSIFNPICSYNSAYSILSSPNAFYSCFTLFGILSFVAVSKMSYQLLRSFFECVSQDIIQFDVGEERKHLLLTIYFYSAVLCVYRHQAKLKY